jgi:tetratricopeptide (TPR) repeat protein
LLRNLAGCFTNPAVSQVKALRNRGFREVVLKLKFQNNSIETDLSENHKENYMKKINLPHAAVLLLFLPFHILGAQGVDPEVEKLMRSGIDYHDSREYDKAIECYEKALKLAPDIPGIYYEIAFSQLYNGKPEMALDYAQKGIDLAVRLDVNDELPGLYDIKGSALDDLGRREEAVKVYLEAITRFSVNNTRLYYNLGLTYYRMGSQEKALDALARSLLSDTFHPSSNFLAGTICYELGRKTQCLYSLCYFLLLEPNTERAETAYETIRQLILETDSDEISVSDSGSFTGLDLILGLMLASSGNENESADSRLIKKLGAFFKIVDEQKAEPPAASPEDLWWKFYIPFFSRLAGSEHFETFCRYIGMSSSGESRDWIDENAGKIDVMFEWLNAD